METVLQSSSRNCLQNVRAVNAFYQLRILSCLLMEMREKLVTCPYCKEVFTHRMEIASGDPRNLAYILHWDGLQPFDGKYNHGSRALKVQIANMCKEDRQKQCEILLLVLYRHIYCQNKGH